MTVQPHPHRVLEDLWISALAPLVSESHTPAAQNVTGAAAKDARGPRWCPRCHINQRFKGTERGGTTVTANSPSSRLFTRLKCAKSRFCSRGLCREHPTAFQRRARWAVISPSPPCWLRSFSIEANEKKNSQKEKNNPSRRLQSESSSGNAESFWKSPPPPRSVQEWGQDGLLVAPMATARRHVGSIQTPVSYLQSHGVVCSHAPFVSGGRIMLRVLKPFPFSKIKRILKASLLLPSRSTRVQSTQPRPRLTKVPSPWLGQEPPSVPTVPWVPDTCPPTPGHSPWPRWPRTLRPLGPPGCSGPGNAAEPSSALEMSGDHL